MPKLQRPRHELFVQRYVKNLALGGTQAQAYIASGYTARDHGAEVCASRLLNKVEIMDRVRELQQRGARRAEVTVESVIGELEQARQAALAAEQTGPAVAASMGKAKVSGLTDRKGENDAPTDFAQCKSEDEIITLLIDDFGDEHDALAFVDRVRELLVERLANKAKLIEHEAGADLSAPE